MASSVAGHRRAFGADMVPGMLRGSRRRPTSSCWSAPTPPGAIRCCIQRMLDARGRGAARKIVVIDPRRTATGDDRRPASADRARHRRRAVQRPARASRRARRARPRLHRRATRRASPRRSRARARSRRRSATVARRRGLPARDARDVLTTVRRDASGPSPATRQGVNQSAQGTDKVNAIINCHLATGRIGRPGMGPFSLTGQPNAMGGREVGGLANMLAAHMGFADPRTSIACSRFWDAPRMATRPGLKAVEMFEAVADGASRRCGSWPPTRPCRMPRRRRACASALRQLARSSSSPRTCWPTDTIARCAHVLLPAAAWGEKDGTVTNSERRISRQRAFLPPPGEARPDWWIVCRGRAAHGLRRAPSPIAPPPRSSASTPRCRLSRTTAARDFDIGGLAELERRRVRRARARAMAGAGRARQGRARFFADGGFFTPDRKARFVAPSCAGATGRAPRRLPVRAQHRPRARPVAHHDAHREDARGSPRTGRSPSSRCNPADAARLNLRHGDLARVSTAHGAAVLEVAVERGAAARVAVRANSLERRELFEWADRRAGPRGRRSAFRPARREGDAGRDRAGARERRAASCCRARHCPRRRARGPVVGAGRGRRRVRHAVRDDACGTRYRRMGAGPVLRRGARRIRR